MSSLNNDEILNIKDLNLAFKTGRHREKVVLNDFTLSLKEGEVLGLVGESGCGKSTLSRILMGLQRADSGELLLYGNKQELNSDKDIRDRRLVMQMIFQDPYSSINPYMTMKQVLEEPMKCLRPEWNSSKREEKCKELLSMVSLEESYLYKNGREMSGGQRQRIGIARAISCEPRILICDEPVSALDLSVQAQILNLLKDLKTNLGLTMIFISHDLGVVRYIADRVAIMKDGAILEEGEAENVLQSPRKEYTRYLLDSVLSLNTGKQ